MAYNEELDPTPQQDILNVFVAEDLSAHLSSYSDIYKRAWAKEKLIHSSILSTWGCPYACIIELSIALNHKEIASIMEVTCAIFPKKMPMQLSDMNKRKQYCPMQHLLVINENK